MFAQNNTIVSPQVALLLKALGYPQVIKESQYWTGGRGETVFILGRYVEDDNVWFLNQNQRNIAVKQDNFVEDYALRPTLTDLMESLVFTLKFPTISLHIKEGKAVYTASISTPAGEWFATDENPADALAKLLIKDRTEG